MRCPRCQHENRPQAKFCEECACPFNRASPTAPSYAELKTEVERIGGALTEALEQQTATADILRVIASSPTDLQPVMDVVAASAARFCGASNAAIWRLEGESLRLVATHGPLPLALTIGGTIAPRPGTVSGRAVRDRRAVHVEDMLALPETEYPEAVEWRRQHPHSPTRTLLVTPLLREGVPIGVIHLPRGEVQPFTAKQVELAKTFADQAVIAIENVRLFKELEDRNREVTETLEQQTATADILRVIASSPTDLQPVMEAVAENAARVCGAPDSSIYRLEGEHLRLVARRGSLRRATVIGDTVPVRRDDLLGRPVGDRRTIHVEDIQAAEAEFPATISRMREAGSLTRTLLATPLLREGTPLGVIVISRGPEVHPFSAKQIALLETFANQAVIAIENVRLFNETKEALEQQTATAEILRVIASSPTDLQPVMEAVVENAARVCGATDSSIFRLEGEHLRLMALHGPLRRSMAIGEAIPVGRGTVGGQVVHDRRTIHVEDIMLAEAEFPETVSRMRQRGSLARTLLGTPLLREGTPLGVIFVNRGPEPNPFSAKQIALLETFANQAVIAIENVRLFTELQEKNRALTEAHAQVTESLEQQTATGEILRVISQSPTDVQPVFDIIAQRAVNLSDAEVSTVARFDGAVLQLAALHGVTREGVEAVRAVFPTRLDAETLAARAFRARAVIHVEDVLADPRYRPKDAARAGGWRGALAVPMFRGTEVIGVIFVGRSTARLFTDSQIELLKTFADQAVIAIENVRLFTELGARNRELTEALEQQTATAEILRVISSSPTDLQPVMDVVAKSAARFCGATDASIFRLEGESLRVVAVHGLMPGTTPIGGAFAVSAGSVAGRVVRDRRAIHIGDFQTLPEAEFPETVARTRGATVPPRTVLATPLLREGMPIGVIYMRRSEVQPFTNKQMALAKTFADQAVIAIENVRLFQELQARTAQLTRSVEELRALGEVGQAVSSTLELETVLNTIASRAAQLAGADGAAIVEYDEVTREFRMRATHNYDPELVETIRAMPIRMGEGLSGRAAERREPMQVPDMLQEGAYESHLRDILVRMGHRALLAVPLMRENEVIGALVVNRRTPGEFSPEVVELLKTFATQSALAIQNARLFREIEEKSRQLEAASRHKSEFLANMSHELRTPLNAILGFNEMILGQIYGEVPADLREPLTDIQHSGKHLLRLINHVLDLSKIEAGRMELALTDYAVQDIVERVRASLQSLAAEKGLAFVATVSADIPLAYGDGGRITQCLMNLAGNALKFTHRGRVELGVELQGDVLVYRVADTGIGIAPDKIEGVFTEFRQGDATITSEFGGTGLGLSITRKFVEMHGGRIWVESEVGRGSTFFFAIPVRLTGGTPA